LRPAGHVNDRIQFHSRDKPARWLERAEEAHSIAEQLSDPESRRMMLRIAEDYERLATHARRRKKGGTAQS
jgi:hypothetical protein